MAFRESYSRFSDSGAAPFERVGVQARLAWNLLRMEKYLEAKAICEPIIARYEHIEINDSKMADGLARHYDTVGRIDFIEGRYEPAEKTYRKAKELRQVGGNIALLAHSDGNLAGVAAMLGDWADPLLPLRV